MGILAIFIALLMGDLALWLLGDRQFAARSGLRWRIMRWLWNAFMIAMLAYPVLILLLSVAGVAGARRRLDFIPAPVVASIFTWHLLVLPLTLSAWLFAGLAAAGHRFSRGLLRRWFASRAGKRPPAAGPAPAPAIAAGPAALRSPQPAAPAAATGQSAVGAAPGMSRRDLLLTAAIAAPPLFTGGLTTWGMRTSGNIRIRQIEVPVPGLPAALEGMVIAHLSDVHVGKWTSGPALKQIVRMTNDLGGDIVAFTGDLIDFALEDLPQGLEMLSQLRAPVFLCEGNHDLIENPERFVREVKGAGARLLVQEWAFVEHRGQAVQIMGLPWARGELTLQNFAESAAAFIRPGAFPLLLAHHPHAFDYAAGFPLVLSGHTHGGQLMLTKHFGAGSFMFRYLSGLYRHPHRSLVVSNGAGNWYPLRINAPPEILRLTLRPA